MVGHQDTECRKGTKRVWVQKQQVQPMIHTPVVDQDGFQRALKPIRVRSSIAVPTQVTNTFQLLNADDVGTEPVRGLNLAKKQGVVKSFIHKHHVGLVGLLEHKVKVSKLGNLYQNVFLNWCFTSNSSFHDGGRIVLAWNPSSFTVSILSVTSQLIHCSVQVVGSSQKFFCTFIYAFNESHKRLELWKDLKTLYTQDPWIVCGDFNCIMAAEERIGALVRSGEIVDICECMHFCGMEDVKSPGNHFTWNNKHQGSARVFSKIDRVMENSTWQGNYPTTEVCFMNEGTFDHSPGLITVYPRIEGGKKPFKYFTIWKSSSEFTSIVKDQWDKQFHGTKMYVVVSKLKQVKFALKELNRKGFNDIQAADLKAFNELTAAQKAMHLNPTDHALADLELQAIKEYKMKHEAYLAFLRQKAKLYWLKAGDENTNLFHQSIRQRCSQNQIYSIHDMHGGWKEESGDVTKAFLEYYDTLLGTTQPNRRVVLRHIVHSGPLINDTHRAILNAPYTAEEVKKALFSIPGVKAPGPDGFGAYFFKDTWEIVGEEVVAAILDVLQQGKLLKELNHTCVTKVLCGRLRQILPDLILENQGGFVHGRHIVHNIMVVHDLVKHYGRKDVKPSCLMKIDLQKAYDTVD
ncbi:uncharacterized protein [Spinacia oleracea]|uniref:Reverse transcriptase domain-containing protein n=1 Tax=Spinacia oleracea TaxID=3562 RepID=A0ABM3QYN0_SPIOL|nr:uncharacterized protein LOC130463366 [Spinacia oleracea]